jgi:hypothetical protein
MGEDEEWRDRCSSASCPPAARRVVVESGRHSAERVFGTNGRLAIARFEPERERFCSKMEVPWM